MAIYLVLTSVFFVLFYVGYWLFFRKNINRLSVDKSNDIAQFLSQNIDKIEIDGVYKKYLPIYIVIAIIGFLVLWVIGVHFIILGIIGIVAIYLPFFIQNTLQKHRLALFEKQLPDAIDLMAGSLRAGNSLIGAFSLIGEEFPKPLSDEIGLIVREQKLGVSVDESLQNFANRMPYNSVILTVSTIRTAMQTGGELSDALNNIAKTLRNIEQAEGKIKALTAQGKMQAWVVGLMPVVLMLVLHKMEPEAMSELWSTQVGYMALGAIAILEFLGIVFIKKIVNIDV